jgi:hypothetical protein
MLIIETGVLTALERCLVDEIEEETSGKKIPLVHEAFINTHPEWEASDEYPSSEPEYNDVDVGI